MEAQTIQSKIYEIRGSKVMLDSDLSILYGTETRVLKQAVKRNRSRFPSDFMFELTAKEIKILRSQIVISSWGGSRYKPYVFTEQGVAMLASILNSPKAIKVNIAIVRAFVLVRNLANSNKEIKEQLKRMEEVYNRKFKDINSALAYLMRKDSIQGTYQNRKRIGFKTNSTGR